MKLNRLGKYYYLKFIRLKGDPRSLALGTAIGVFVGLTPTIPLHTIAASVPAGTTVTSLSGDAEIESGSRAGPARTKKQLVVGFETPMGDDGALPAEIDDFLGRLRGEASIKRHFPLIEVSGVRASPVRKGGTPSATYSVICLPKVEAARSQPKGPVRKPARS